MPAIDFEITIERKNASVRPRFAHPNQTRIGQAHWHIGITPPQRDNRFDFVLQVERKLNNSLAKKIKNSSAVAAAGFYKINSLGNRRLTGDQRRFERIKAPDASRMINFVRVKISNERTGIQNHRFHSPKPFIYFLFVARSFTPLRKLPQASCIKS